MFNFKEKEKLAVCCIAQFAEKTGERAFFVGGMVRDALMGREIKDIDILVEGSAIDFVQGLKAEFENVIQIDINSIHKDFDTAKTVINDIEIDFASTREEIYPKSGCLPVVKNVGCKIEDDLKRRDFTVNSIAARIVEENGEICYEIFDPFFGADDIKEKKLKILHKKSYIDDPTRILRGLDFNLRFGFEFSDTDKELIEEYMKKPDREGLSVDRVKLTLRKLFSNLDRAKTAYEKVFDLKIYKIWTDVPCFKREWDENIKKACEIFKQDSGEIFREIVFLEENLPQNFGALDEAGFQNSANLDWAGFKGYGEKGDEENFRIYEFFKKFKDEDLALYYGITGDEASVYYYKKLKNIKTKMTGKDLISLGFKQGKALGEALLALLKDEIINGEKSLEEEKEFILRNFKPQ